MKMYVNMEHLVPFNICNKQRLQLVIDSEGLGADPILAMVINL